MKRQKKAMALVLTLFLITVLTGFISLATYQYVSDNIIHQHYEINLKGLYEIEAARNALLWEEWNASAPDEWGTDDTPRLKNATVSNGFYRISGYNFRAKVIYSSQAINMYIHFFTGDESAPQNSQYLEYIYSPSPMYKYFMFSNKSLTFAYPSQTYQCKGGSIHTNGDIIFHPHSSGFRFNGIGEMTASGTIKYENALLFSAPYHYDDLDGVTDGMAPAPSLTAGGHHHTTADDVNVVPGPFYYYGSSGSMFLKTNAEYLISDSMWGTDFLPGYGPYPLPFRGEEAYFSGRQASGSFQPLNYSWWYERKIGYMKNDGTDQSYLGQNPAGTDKATVNGIYREANGPLRSDAKVYDGTVNYLSVYFKPYKNKTGALNNEWFELPGSLPGNYTWVDKYKSLYGSVPVTFYITESCPQTAAGCKLDPLQTTVDPANTTGWRYMKRNAAGYACTTADDDCYNLADSGYVKAQDYEIAGKSYYSYMVDKQGAEYATQFDANKEFFDDYVYGDDIHDLASPYRQISVLDTQKQQSGFFQYLDLLSQKGVEGVLNSGIPLKGPFYSIFDEPGKESTYKFKAIGDGIYVGDGTSTPDLDAIVAALNLGAAEVFASKKSFYNWKTAQIINLIDLDVGKMKNLIKPANGVIYSEVPLRLSNAANLPGENVGGKTAVFTVISEESIYLKGDYNLHTSSDPSVDTWKISHIATKKKVYTLSDVYSDPQYIPDFAAHPNNFYTKALVTRNASNQIISYDDVVDDQSPIPVGSTTEVWISGLPPKLASYPPMTQEFADLVTAKHAARQTGYNSNHPDPLVNKVDRSYTYNSLFITPGLSDFWTLECWRKADGSIATRNFYGAFLNFTSVDPDSTTTYDNYKAALGQEEYSTGSGTYAGINGCNRGGGYASQPYKNNTSVLGQSLTSYVFGGSGSPTDNKVYDDRFPTAVPASSEAVFGFTGVNSWRFVSQEYFDEKTE
ncbi:MAG: hypothetical protein WCY05_05620 [Candidatus Omnitrophota bacterium]